MTVEELVLKISGDSHGGEEAAKKVGDALLSAFESPQGAIQRLGTLLIDSVVSPLGAVALGGAAVIGVGAGVAMMLYEWAEKAAHTGAELNDMSEKTQIAVEPLSALRFAAQVASVDFEKLGNAVFMMQKRIGEKGSWDEVRKGLTALHIDTKAFLDLSPDEKILAVSNGFRQYGKEVNTASTVTEIFGRQGRETLPLLMKPLDDLVAKARELGVTWSEEDAKAAEEFEMASRLLNLELQSIEMRIGRALIPTFGEMFKSLGNNKQLMGDLEAAIVGAATVLGYLVEWTGKWAASSLQASANSSSFAAMLYGLKAIVLETIATVLEALSKLPGASLVLGSSLAWVLQKTAEAKAEALLYAKAAVGQARAANDVATVTSAAGKALQGLGKDLKQATGATDEHRKATEPLTREQAAAAKAAADHAKAIQALTDKLSGDGAIHATNDLFEALQKLPPLHNLTKESQVEIAKTMEQAIAVYKAAGRDIPESWHLIAMMARAESHTMSEAVKADMAETSKALAAPFKNFHLPVSRVRLESHDLISIVAAPFVEGGHQISTYESVLRAHGIFTAKELEKTADDYHTEFTYISTHAGYTADQIEAAFQKWRNADTAAGRSWTAGWVSNLGVLASALGQFQNGGLRGLGSTIGSVVQAIDVGTESTKRWGNSAGVAAPIFSKTATTTQKWSAAIQSGAAIAGGAMDIWNASADAGSKAAGALHGAMAGAKAGAAFGPWGVAIGAAAGALVGFIRNMNAGRNAVKDFANSFDTAASGTGFDELHTKLLTLGAAGETLWVKLTQGVGRSDPAAAKAVIAEITAAFEKQKAQIATENDALGQLLQSLTGLGAGSMLEPYLEKLTNAKDLTADNVALLQQLAGEGTADWHKIQDAVQRYGGDIATLGGTFQEQRLHESWQQIIDDMDLFGKGGISAGDALNLTKAKIIELAQQSLKFRTEIPENMRPWLQNLIDSGELLDASGAKITDINTLKFGVSLQTSIQILIDKISAFIDKLSAIPSTIATIPKSIDIDQNVTRHYRDDGDPGGGETPGASRGGLVTPYGIEPLHMALGGLVPNLLAFRPLGTDTVPTMLTPGEIVLTDAQRKSLAAAGVTTTIEKQQPPAWRPARREAA